VTPEFVPNLELNARYYEQVVEPLVRAWPHGAARLGWGSEVLGFDTERSTDHGWGLRLVVFVDADDVEPARIAVNDGLPETFDGWPVRYGWDLYPVVHHVELTTLAAWLIDTIGCDATTGMSAIDWLLAPQQQLLGVTRGAVYRDDTGALTDVRVRLQWYPDEVARWILACQWQRVAQEEAFVGRTAEVGDELGSRLVAARLVRELMRLHFVLASEYWPYSKWFGSAYRALAGASELLPALEAATAATTFEARESALVTAYEALATMHNEAALTEAVDPTARNFYARPFRVIDAERFVGACRASISDPWLQSLPLVGSIDQFVDSTDVLSFADIARRLRSIYDAS
jgi:Domain of unknown function (DUF4037)